MNFRFHSLYIYYLLTCFASMGQIKDADLWTSLGVEKKISQSFQASLHQEFRFNENITELGNYFTDLGGTYRLNEALRVSANYRFINKRKANDFYSKRHRYYVDFAYKDKRDKLTSTFRLRFQSQYSDVFSSDDGKIPALYLRPKFSFRYDMGIPLKPYIATELFYSVSAKEFDNIRYALGLEKKIYGKLDGDVFFLHQREFNVNEPVFDYIWGLGLTYSL